MFRKTAFIKCIAVVVKSEILMTRTKSMPKPFSFKSSNLSLLGLEGKTGRGKKMTHWDEGVIKKTPFLYILMPSSLHFNCSGQKLCYMSLVFP